MENNSIKGIKFSYRTSINAKAFLCIDRCCPELIKHDKRKTEKV